MKTILIVDDDPVSVRLIEMIVARHGYSTASAGSAAEARAVLDSGRAIDILIADQNLGGTSGLELCAALRADVRFRGLPIIMCTGVAGRSTVEEAMRLGIRQFIVKPIAPAVVIQKVDALLADQLRVLEPRAEAISRLQLTDTEYKVLARASQQHLTVLREELAQAQKGIDRGAIVAVVSRLREPANLLGAARLVAAIDHLEATHTWRELDEAAAAIVDEIDAVEGALEAAARPQLIPRPPGYVGPV